MRIPVIAGNWKLYKKSCEAVALANELVNLTKQTTGVEIVVAPCFTVLASVSAALAGGTHIALAGQDCHWQEEGAYTGEVSPGMLLDAGCSHVLIGHSERRQYFAETDATVNKKVKAALKAGLVVIVCIGETLVERESGTTFTVLERQLTAALAGLSHDAMTQILIAYEPVWAIGTGKTARDDQAQEAHAFIRNLLGTLFTTEIAAATRILYGGSVKPDNISGLMAQADIDGALVGGASLVAESFAAIVNYRK
jgi:triosephosphate isomerase (TIM)